VTRTYTLKKRAASQAETRRRIVEAAVELHSTIGPARTTFSMLAEQAGVQRHTLYADGLFGAGLRARPSAGREALARHRGST
jgi:hypothetical protein